MKKNMKTMICLMLFAALSLTVRAKAIINDSLPYLEIKGKISKKGKPDGTYRAELLYKNTVVDSKEVNDGESFSFIIPGNRDYTVKIHKKGYVTKVIGINTGLHRYEYAEKFYRYEFTTEMEELLYRSIENDLMERSVNTEDSSDKFKEFYNSRKYIKKLKALP